tara:strand:- start:816 stop:1649 length:834 start_codon:yes stop_codon:yes gene_type:complete
MNKNLKSPLRYPGGKSKAVKNILPLVPYFQEYREPFVGGGSIFLALKHKFPEKKFWINDIYIDLFSFWSKLKDDTEKLIDEVQKIFDEKLKFENGRPLYDHFSNLKTKDPLQLAIKFFILNRITFSGTIEAGGFSKASFETRFTQSSIDRLKGFDEILKNVKITCFDYSKVIESNGKNVFLFFDPPYSSNTKSSLYGKKGELHKIFNHEEFASKIKYTSHKWLLTYDDNSMIRELYKDFNLIPWELQYGMNNYKQSNAAKGKELIITNYDLEIFDKN